MDKNVIFRYGTKAQFDAIAVKDANTLYWLYDTKQLYKGDELYGSGAEATRSAAGLLSPEDKAKLDALAAGGAIGLSAVDKSVVLDTGEDGMTTIGVQLSKVEGNALELREDGLFVGSAGGEAGSIDAGSGIQKEGNTVSVHLSAVAANGLAVDENGLRMSLATAEHAGAMSADDKNALDKAVGDIEAIMGSIQWEEM